jgi:hypothetical protein
MQHKVLCLLGGGLFSCEAFDGVLVYVFHESLMVTFGIFRCVSFLMECLCMAPLTPAMMVVSGLVCHPLICIVLMRGVVFFVFVCEGLIQVYVVTICEFNELGCECGGGYICICV